MKFKKAFNILLNSFRVEDSEDEQERKRNRAAEEKVFRDILEEMQDEKGKIRKFKGGRWGKIEGKKPLKITKNLEMDEDEYEESQTLWHDYGGAPRDLTTLMINILMYKFSVKLSLDTKLMMSVNGKFLYLVLRSDIKDLKSIAEESGYNL